MSDTIKQGQVDFPLPFLMISSIDHITGQTGLMPTVTLSKNGHPFAPAVGVISEIGDGWYQVAPNSSDDDTLGPLLLHATATNADPYDIEFTVIPDWAGAEISNSDRIASSTGYYGSVGFGDIYWAGQLGGVNWKESSNADKQLALGSATRLIEQLRYKGEKTSHTQLFKWPRHGQSTIPLDIEYAAYEIAEQLLNRVDTELDTRNLTLLQTSYGSMSATIRAANTVPDHLAAGIPSVIGWRYLLPHLKPVRFRRFC